MMKNLFVLVLVGILLVSGCVSNPETKYKKAGDNCRENSECQSSVCDLYKQEIGRCAPVPCSPGDKTNHNDFYCGENKQWQKSKEIGSACQNDYECFQLNCYEVPYCNIKEIVSCKNSVCTSEAVKDECEKQGLKKILRKDQYSDECFESVAQMELPTVCTPCGNGICDQDLETKCNCPVDCLKQI